MTPSVWGRKRGFRVPPGPLVIGLLMLALLGIALTSREPAGALLSGRFEVVDGDTLRLGAARFRLIGIDAPELDQTCIGADGTEWLCGREARAFLAAHIRQQMVSCASHGRDTYARILARCTARGADLGADIVRAGWAVSTDGYASEALAAKAQLLGIWSGRFDQPLAWRRSHDPEQPALWQWIRSWFQ